MSMVEVVIVIIIIAVLVAGVVASINLMHKAKMASIRQVTSSSPVNSVKDLGLWLETSSTASFLENEGADDETISQWKDIKAASLSNIDSSQSSDSNKPKFMKKQMNGIDAITFDGVDDYLEFDGSLLNNTDYTIFVVEKRAGSEANNYFIGDDSVDSENENLLLGYQASGTGIHSHTGDNSYDYSVSTYEGSKQETRIFAFLQNSSSGKETRINGLLVGQSENKDRLENISTLKIGNGYSGSIGEIIIYTRALKDSEREDIENYLGKKWAIRVNHSTSVCDGGTAASSLCNSSCTVDLMGVATPSTVLESAGSGTGQLSCNEVGYTGIVPYVCANAQISYSGSCDCNTSGSPTYTRDSVTNECQAGCTVASTGINSIYVDHEVTSSIICNTGYTGTITYDCDNGSPNLGGICDPNPCDIAGTHIVDTHVEHGESGAIPCETGYEAPGQTYECLLGEANQTASACTEKGCTISATGITTVNVTHGQSNNITCNSGYTGAISYNCVLGEANQTGKCDAKCNISATGITAAVVNHGDSNTITCNSGYSGSISYDCDDGAPNITGYCYAACTVSATGITTTTVAHGDADDITCNAGYTGTVSYNCDDGSPNITGSCLADCSVSGTGITTTTVNDGDSGSITCNSGYSGSISYNCSNGNPNKTGACYADCSVSGTGITTTTVSDGDSGSVTCNSGYSGSIAYNCSNGNPNKTGSCLADCSVSGTGITTTTVSDGDGGSISCNSGYSGSIAYNCSNGNANQSGSCLADCSVAATGITTTTVSDGATGSITCNSGYTGSVSYNCSNGNPNKTGSCTALLGCTVSGTGITTASVSHGATGSITCNSGYIGSVSYNCNNGNTNQTGSCSVAAGCSVSGTGITTTSVNHGATGSITCNSGYTGSVSYNCNNGNANQSGSCSVAYDCVGTIPLNEAGTVFSGTISANINQTGTVSCPSGSARPSRNWVCLSGGLQPTSTSCDYVGDSTSDL